MAGFRPAGMALAVAAAFLGMGHALGQPTGAQAIAGQAQLKQQGNSLVVTTQNAAGTNRSVINWQSFSVPAGSTTRFDQPTAQSLSINRVVGNDPSAIYGTLSSNGRLVLVNPAGIAVGAGAVVDTAGFTASTLKMSDADALAGRLTFGDGLAGAGALKVDGNIVARSGDVVLIAPNVQVGSQAVMQAPNGAAILAAGQKVELTGRGLEGIVMQVQAPENSAVNLGTLQGNAVGIFAGTLKHSGLVQANAVTAEGGKVVLKAQDTADISGTVQAAKGDVGGLVQATANKVMLRSGATIDVSGPAGGGVAEIGGGWQGHDASLANAKQTVIEQGALIRADAIESGNGGTVSVWSDEHTQFSGAISARGGANGGDGGNVETSGHVLDFSGAVDTRAPKGAIGNLLLDPTNIYIANSQSNATSAGMGGTDISADTSGPTTFQASGTVIDSFLSTGSLTTALASTSVTVTTTSSGAGTGFIKVVDPITWSSGNQLSLLADSSVIVNGSISSTYLGGATLGLRAFGGNITQGAPISVASLFAYADAGSVTLTNAANSVGTLAGYGPAGFSFTNNGNLSIGYVSTAAGASYGVHANAGNITIKTTGDLSVDDTVYGVKGGTGSVDLSAGGYLNVSSSSLITTQGGAIALSAGDTAAGSQSEGSLNVYGNLDTTGGGAVPTGANVTLKSGLSDVGGNSVYVSGVVINAGSAGAVQATGQRIDIGSSAITGNSFSASSSGDVAISLSTIGTSGGGISINSTGPGSSVQLSGASLDATGGGQVHIDSDQGPVAISNSTILSSGDVYINAGQSTPVTGADGVTITDSRIDAGAPSSIWITGLVDSYSFGVVLQGNVTLSAGGGSSVYGENYSSSVSGWGGGLYLAGSTAPAYLTGSGPLTIQGYTANDGYGLYVSNATVDRNGGDVTLLGAATQGTSGVWLDYSTLTTGGGALTVASNSQGVQINATSLGTFGGNISIAGGGPSLLNGHGVSIVGSEVHAGTGDVTIAGESVNEYGFYSSLGPAGAISGRNITITGKNSSLWSGWGGIFIDTEQIAGTGVVQLNAVNGGLSANASVISGDSGLALSAPVGGVYLTSSTLSSAGGSAQVDGTSISVDSSAISTGPGAVSLTATDGGVHISTSSIATAGGDIALRGGLAIESNGVYVYGSTLDAGAGALTLNGQARYATGVVIDTSSIRAGSVSVDGAATDSTGSGVEVNVSTIDAGSGTILLKGTTVSASNWGVDFVYGGSSLAAGAGTTVIGTNTGTSLYAGAGGVRLSGDGPLDVRGPLSVTGTATDAAGTGVVANWMALTSDSSVSITGTGGYYGVDLEGIGTTIGAPGGLAVVGTTAAGSGAPGVYLSQVALDANNFLTLGSINGDLLIESSQIQNTGPGAMSLYALSGPGPASRITIDASSSVQQSGGADLTLSADAMTLAGSIGSGAGRTVIAPSSSSRGIWIGGTDDGSHLTLDTTALQGITASALVIGSTANDGGLSVLAPLTLTNAPTLSLIQYGDANGTIDQAPGAILSVPSLQVSGGGVTLTEANSVQVLSGSANAGGFRFNNAASGLQIGTADGMSGIQAMGGTIQVTTPGLLQLTQLVASDAAAGSNAITLVADSLATSGGGALQALNDRWAVFLQAPGAGLAGSPVSGNSAVWNRPFTGNLATDLPETGNRYVFAYQPQVTITASPASKVYDGSNLFTGAATVAGIPDASASGGVFNQDAVTVTLSTASKNVGTYSFAVDSVVQPAGYGSYAVSLGSATGTITPLAITGTISAANKVYDSTTLASTSGSLSGAVLGDIVSLASSGSFADKNAGTGKTVAVTGALSGADAGNYTLTSNTTATADITPATLTVAGLTANDRVYDSTTAATFSGTPTASGVFAGDTVGISGGAIGSFADKNVGTNKPVTLNPASLTLTGTDGGNYLISAAGSYAASITPATLTLGGLTANDKVYDATTAATLSGTATLAGLFAGDSVSFTGTPMGSFSDKNVGTHKAVTLGTTGALAGIDAGNYQLVAPAGLFASITPAPLTVAAIDQNKPQGTTFTFTGSEIAATGLKGGEQLTSAALSSTGAAADVPFGNYPIIVGGPLAGASGFAASNYLVTYQPGTLVVSPFNTPATQQVNNTMITFLQLFVQEALPPPKDKPKGDPDIVVTGTLCKPS